MTFICAQIKGLLMKLSPIFQKLKDTQILLGNTFDYEFFCLGLGLILSSDYQPVVVRVIELLYTASPVFVGQARRYIYLKFLIKEYFFKLFLHWDDIVRSYFIQLIVNAVNICIFFTIDD